MLNVLYVLYVLYVVYVLYVRFLDYVFYFYCMYYLYYMLYMYYMYDMYSMYCRYYMYYMYLDVFLVLHVLDLLYLRYGMSSCIYDMYCSPYSFLCLRFFLQTGLMHSHSKYRNETCDKGFETGLDQQRSFRAERHNHVQGDWFICQITTWTWMRQCHASGVAQ